MLIPAICQRSLSEAVAVYLFLLSSLSLLKSRSLQPLHYVDSPGSSGAHGNVSYGSRPFIVVDNDMLLHVRTISVTLRLTIHR